MGRIWPEVLALSRSAPWLASCGRRALPGLPPRQAPTFHNKYIAQGWKINVFLFPSAWGVRL